MGSSSSSPRKCNVDPLFAVLYNCFYFCIYSLLERRDFLFPVREWEIQGKGVGCKGMKELKEIGLNVGKCFIPFKICSNKCFVK